MLVVYVGSTESQRKKAGGLSAKSLMPQQITHLISFALLCVIIAVSSSARVTL